MNKNDDRFTKIAKNYGELFTEVFTVLGLDYEEFQYSVFKEACTVPNFKSLPILDIGAGDGKTSRAFIEAGCTDLTGIDLNQEMLDQAAAKYGNKIKLVQANATDLQMFHTGQFPIIIAAAAIHNITKNDREKFWAEMLRLSPKMLVLAEKIVNPDPVKHKADIVREKEAIKEVYLRRHNLPEAAQTWLDHYDYDERERLEMSEIENALGERYNIEITYEAGMNKTVRCTAK